MAKLVWRAAGVAGLLIAALAACSPSFRSGAYSTFLQDNRKVEPFEIAPDLFYVGSSDIAVYALRTRDGVVVIDGGYASTGRRVLENLRTLGIEPADVRILLNTHAHMDHAGGFAAIKRATGAVLYASPGDAPLLAAGGRGDFALRDWMTYPPVAVDRTLGDGEVVTLGDRALTAHFTPGHTKGCTSWSFTLAVDGEETDVVVLCTLTVLPFYRLDDNARYPDITADFEATFARLETLPCELFLADHGKFFDLAAKRRELEAGAASNPFVDPAGCRAFIAKAEADFRRRAGD